MSNPGRVAHGDGDAAIRCCRASLWREVVGPTRSRARSSSPECIEQGLGQSVRLAGGPCPGDDESRFFGRAGRRLVAVASTVPADVYYRGAIRCFERLAPRPLTGLATSYVLAGPAAGSRRRAARQRSEVSSRSSTRCFAATTSRRPQAGDYLLRLSRRSSPGRSGSSTPRSPRVDYSARARYPGHDRARRCSTTSPRCRVTDGGSQSAGVAASQRRN